MCAQSLSTSEKGSGAEAVMDSPHTDDGQGSAKPPVATECGQNHQAFQEKPEICASPCNVLTVQNNGQSEGVKNFQMWV